MSVTYDYHLHSHFSGDCDVPPDQMIEKAIFIGMKGLCFTEHHDPDYPDSGIDFLLDFRPYFEKMEELKEQHKTEREKGSQLLQRLLNDAISSGLEQTR